ncbi:hypothetical protein AAHC03_04485 [Spirometra sp. Aus1]
MSAGELYTNLANGGSCCGGGGFLCDSTSISAYLKCCFTIWKFFMETANLNGFSPEEAVVVTNLSSAKRTIGICKYPPSIQYKLQANHKLMAPRTDTRFLSTLDIQNPCCESSASPEKDVYTSAVPNLDSDPTKSQFMEMPNSSLLGGLTTSADIRTEAVDARLRRLTTRYRLAEKRAILILSKLKSTPCFRTSLGTDPNPALEDYLSENTESSSDDDEFVPPTTRSSKSWYQARAIMRSHWFLLQTEMVRAMDCLQNLKPLRHRCKKWRKSLPLLSQGGLIEPATLGTCSRILPFEKSDKPRHSYFSLNKLDHLDFKFSGSAMPLPLTHPRCREVNHVGCILCCPAFQSTGNTSDSLYRRRDDIASQSLALDFTHPKVSDEIQNCKDSRADYPRVLQSAGREMPSAMILHRKSQSKENASASSSLSTSSQDSHLNNHFRKCVPHSTKNGRHAPIWRINPKDPRMPPSPESTSSDVFSTEAPREIVVPQWRKMPPISATSSMLSHRNSSATVAVGHNLVSCSMEPVSSAPPPCTYEAISLDSEVAEDTSDEHYRELHAVEEANELRRKTGPPHSPLSPHSSAFHAVSD